MTPAPFRLVRLRQIAVQLAERGELTGERLGREALLSPKQARRWIALLLAEGAIRAIGPDPEQHMGRPRTVYGRRRGR